VVDLGGFERLYADCDADGVPGECDCPGDIDFDCTRGLTDLTLLLANYGLTSGAVYGDGDLDSDGDVDIADLATLLSGYGQPCP
jgi:hypothetical protein